MTDQDKAAEVAAGIVASLHNFYLDDGFDVESTAMIAKALREYGDRRAREAKIEGLRELVDRMDSDGLTEWNKVADRLVMEELATFRNLSECSDCKSGSPASYEPLMKCVAHSREFMFVRCRDPDFAKKISELEKEGA